MFIELEMPLVWASDNVGGAAFNYTVQVQREAMVFNRNHPSVIFYSLGNESPWNANFKNSLAGFLREIDESRPFMFDGGNGQTVPPLDLLTVHYPDFAAAESYANAVNPTLFGEYAHLNCYNRREIATDQGVRDIWGLGVEEMWEIVYAAEGVLGACYWAGERSMRVGDSLQSTHGCSAPPPPPPLRDGRHFLHARWRAGGVRRVGGYRRVAAA